ncbi:hypothetical protein D187_007324 [Cystobacter fuscus DSM 2262]|uniref:SHOCT domain-containing protein n=1 Tax=Cystobacter fuscus (strain ATCC 25194 / DSM 2262 / NBRC 100088 / M29) TaxID=1242864 RepID=S9QK69_CYSF2|nr:SHOCT domain-containing protein [Cystobacter fuscus]EPX56888.1 hypothetical protein D187_007324 [Cystobacter fuscus DSM 2262]
MLELTSEGQRAVAELAQRHGVSGEAVRVLLEALAAGGGTQAQFNHPELGGLGQWSQGGMLMVGNMFDHGLKARVDALCVELARRMRVGPLFTPATPGASWPAEFGAPSSSGSQGDVRYAYFPDRRRLVIQRGGQVTIHDTGEHRISGVSQQQGAGQSLTFTSQFGPIRLSELPVMGPAPVAPTSPSATPAAAPSAATDPLSLIERLAELRDKGVLTEEEFAAKKAELLSRL